MISGRGYGDGGVYIQQLFYVLRQTGFNFIADRPKAALLFWFFSVFLDVVFRYLSLFLLYINIKIGKNRYYMLD